MANNRRDFLKKAALAGAGAALYQTLGKGRAWAFAQSPTNLRKFVVSLPGLGPSAKNEIGQYIPLATKRSVHFAGQSTDLYNIVATKFSQTMHPDLPGKTNLFGYSDLFTFDQKYLGGAIVAKRGTPTLLTVTNLIPSKHILPVDPMIMAGPNGLMVGDLPTNRIATHLHGGLTPWFSDGTPFQWFTPTGAHGPSFMNVPGFPALPGTGTYYYPNDQSARLVWYHDHAIGITRLNAYAGIASAFIITDDFEASLVSSGLLPDLVGIPLIIQDKGFVSKNIFKQDSTWRWGNPGDLWYPHDYEVDIFKRGAANPKGRWDWGPTVVPRSEGTKPLPPVSAIPEAFFDTILINGGIYPKVSVPPKRVRFRMLNGSQARFYHLNLYPEDLANSGEARVGVPGPIMYQVATEGGFLPSVAIHDNGRPIPLDLVTDPSGNTAFADGPFNLMLAPAERADVIIDFNGLPAGSSFILYSDSPGPFPGGDPRNDYFTGDPDQRPVGGAPTTMPGLGPNTRTLMKIIVTAGTGDSLSTANWLPQINTQLRSSFLNGSQPGLLFTNGDPSVGAFPFNGFADRMLTLNEDFDEFGRLIQTVGTFTQNGFNNQNLPTWGRAYLDPVTENPRAGAIEVWQVMNLTGDTHPIHFHLVNVQVIQRQAFQGDPSSWSYIGDPLPPDTNELGWKETVRMNPGEITTVIMQFNLPKLPTAAMRNAVSPRTGGKEYVWHCHILEHEEHDMMRPLIIT
jgi:FtsP/CotA-like multicopper oxidase with cupredoxin domain